MKIKLVCVGTVRSAETARLIDNYVSRIVHYYPFEITVIPDTKSTASTTREKVKESEGRKILAEVSAGDRMILLDERGKEYTSRAFSEMLDRLNGEMVRTLVFVIGGPFGFSDQVYQRANGLLGLSKMTFPHELARLFFVEQLYRAGSIMRGEPYHHD